MNYCKKCVQTDTRPDIYFDENGICGACLWEEGKKTINWSERESTLQQIAREAKADSNGQYDCVIGVSGGKDSLFQAIYARDTLGLRPLLVNGQAEQTTELGNDNLENIMQLGFDVIGIRPNPIVMKKLIIRDFFKNLNIQRPTEYSLWASAYIIADKFDIPLVIQGEDSAETLGVKKPVPVDGNALNADQSNTIRTSPLDLYADTFDGDTAPEDLYLYHYDKESLLRKKIRGVWLSHYVKEWSQNYNFDFSVKRGMGIHPESTNPYDIGTYRLFYQLDSKFLEINQMFKYIKFGFGATTDHVCYDIRDGIITRDEGIFLVREFDGCCGKHFIDNFCKYINISKDFFWDHANKFRGPMWQENDGAWILKNPIWLQKTIDSSISFRKIQEKL